MLRQQKQLQDRGQKSIGGLGGLEMFGKFFGNLDWKPNSFGGMKQQKHSLFGDMAKVGLGMLMGGGKKNGLGGLGSLMGMGGNQSNGQMGMMGNMAKMGMGQNTNKMGMMGNMARMGMGQSNGKMGMMSNMMGMGQSNNKMGMMGNMARMGGMGNMANMMGGGRNKGYGKMISHGNKQLREVNPNKCTIF